jgi:hypothetical protein
VAEEVADEFAPRKNDMIVWKKIRPPIQLEALSLYETICGKPKPLF